MPLMPVNVAFMRGTTRLGFTIQLDTDRSVHQQILICLRQGLLYEAETSDFFCKILRPGDAFIDVGAHIGFFTLLASVLVGSTGHVEAFEPEQSNFDQLTANLQRNQLTNTRTHQLGLWSEAGEATFYVHIKRNDGAHCLFDHGDPETRADAEVRTIPLQTLDQMLVDAPFERVRCLKVDAEGAETGIFRGATRLLSRKAVDFVVCEYNSFCLRKMGTDEMAMRGALAEYGYDCYGFSGNGSLIRVPQNTRIAAPNADVLYNLVFARPEMAYTLT